MTVVILVTAIIDAGTKFTTNNSQLLMSNYHIPVLQKQNVTSINKCKTGIPPHILEHP